jgi:hypothetical protein
MHNNHCHGLLLYGDVKIMVKTNKNVLMLKGAFHHVWIKKCGETHLTEAKG